MSPLNGDSQDVFHRLLTYYTGTCSLYSVTLLRGVTYQIISVIMAFRGVGLGSGGARKISLPGHNRGTIIYNGAHGGQVD